MSGSVTGGRSVEAGLDRRTAVTHPARRVLLRRATALDGLRARERRTAGGGGARPELAELPLVVAELAGVARRPAVVGRLADDLVATDTGRATAARGRVGVRRVVGDVDHAVRVDVDAERVAEAHRVDLRAGLGLRRTGHEREQVPGRDGVRAGARAVVRLVGVGGRDGGLLDLDPEDLAAEIVRVGRAAAGVTDRRQEVPALDVGRDVDGRRARERRHRRSSAATGSSARERDGRTR